MGILVCSKSMRSCNLHGQTKRPSIMRLEDKAIVLNGKLTGQGVSQISSAARNAMMKQYPSEDGSAFLFFLTLSIAVLQSMCIKTQQLA